MNAVRHLLITVVVAAASCAATPPLLRLEPVGFDDPDLRANLALEGGLTLSLANHTDETIEVAWDRLMLIGPDHREHPVHAAVAPGVLAPHGHAEAHLSPFDEPSRERVVLELVVPTVVHGIAREYHFHVQTALARSSTHR